MNPDDLHDRVELIADSFKDLLENLKRKDLCEEFILENLFVLVVVSYSKYFDSAMHLNNAVTEITTLVTSGIYNWERFFASSLLIVEGFMSKE